MTKVTKTAPDTKSAQIVDLTPRIEAYRRKRRLLPVTEATVTQLFAAHDARQIRPLAA
ncbi:MAG: hypothetical protein QNJ44_17690 [Rhodobacter sp.]|nr:hypothetical protein [Rhodobacter sp.]